DVDVGRTVLLGVNHDESAIEQRDRARLIAGGLAVRDLEGVSDKIALDVVALSVPLVVARSGAAVVAAPGQDDVLGGLADIDDAVFARQRVEVLEIMLDRSGPADRARGLVVGHLDLIAVGWL